MKSRTSFFNPTVFKKDVQRFAPVWALFTVLLLMCLVPIAGEGSAYYRAVAISSATGVTGMFAFLYAPLVAQLLFGDLYNARMCNALHALPLRRECWFGTHLTAGLAFGFVPYALVAVMGLLILNLGAAWTVVPLWLLAACAQYLFFFALSALCALTVGNRFSQVIVYGIVNFFSLLVFWLADNLYEPLLPGIRFSQEPFNLFCPVVMFSDSYDLINISYERIRNGDGLFVDHMIKGVSFGDGWGYLAVCALIAVALLLISLILYWKRDLECAGDFVAFRFLEPVFLVFFTLTAGGFCHLFSEIFGLGGDNYLFLAVGLVVGYFAGLMMLQRSTRVFRLGAFLRFGVLVGVFGLTLLVTSLDPFGVTRRIPAAEDVVSVNLSNRWELHYPSDQELTVTDPSDIEKLIQVHEAAIEDPFKIPESGSAWTVNFSVEYTLKDGSSFARFYEIDGASAAAEILEDFYTRFECVMGFPEEQIPERAKDLYYIYTNSMRDNTGNTTGRDMEGLLNAIAADCAAGNMAQSSAYHLSSGVTEGSIVIECSTYLELGFNADVDVDRGYVDYRNLYVYDSCTNTLQWLEENGLYDPGLEDEYYG